MAIKDDVTWYSDIATDSNQPNEQAGIIRFYQLWHRNLGDRKPECPLMLVSLMLDIEIGLNDWGSMI